MEFRRRGRSRFRAGEFTIKRPSGRALGRDRLAVGRVGHDYEFRFDQDRLWLLDGEREVGFAQGSDLKWHILFGELSLTLEQAKAGVCHSAATDAGGAIVAQVRGSGFPLKLVETHGADELSEEQLVFLVAIALLGWRESDRAMISPGRAAPE